MFCNLSIVVSRKDGSYCRRDIRQQNKLLKPKVVMLAIALQLYSIQLYGNIADTRLWMTQNLLKLNDNKTYIIYLVSPHYVKSLKTPASQMGTSSIAPNGSVENLGVICY